MILLENGGEAFSTVSENLLSYMSTLASGGTGRLKTRPCVIKNIGTQRGSKRPPHVYLMASFEGSENCPDVLQPFAMPVSAINSTAIFLSLIHI